MIFIPDHVSSEEKPDGTEDYHHRKGMRVEKRFKLVPNKVSYRPRLRIRRPGELIKILLF